MGRYHGADGLLFLGLLGRIVLSRWARVRGPPVSALSNSSHQRIPLSRNRGGFLDSDTLIMPVVTGLACEPLLSSALPRPVSRRTRPSTLREPLSFPFLAPSWGSTSPFSKHRRAVDDVAAHNADTARHPWRHLDGTFGLSTPAPSPHAVRSAGLVARAPSSKHEVSYLPR